MPLFSLLCGVVIAQAGPPSANADKQNPTGDYLPSLTFDVASIHEFPVSSSYMETFQDPPHSSLLRLTNVPAPKKSPDLTITRFHPCISSAMAASAINSLRTPPP